MRLLQATVGGIFLITFLASPGMAGGWFWDLGNALGFVAFAGLIYLTITSARPLDVNAHRVLSYVVLVLVLGHVFWFLLGDATVVEFVKIDAPNYMWLGVVSALLLAIIMTIALIPDRLRVHKDYRSFKFWHRIIGITIVCSAAYHIVVSHFYLSTWYQVGLFLLVTIAACFGRKYWVRLGRIRIASPAVFLSLGCTWVVLFVGVRNLLA